MERFVILCLAVLVLALAGSTAGAGGADTARRAIENAATGYSIQNGQLNAQNTLETAGATQTDFFELYIPPKSCGYFDVIASAHRRSDGATKHWNVQFGYKRHTSDTVTLQGLPNLTAIASGDLLLFGPEIDIEVDSVEIEEEVFEPYLRLKVTGLGSTDLVWTYNWRGHQTYEQED